MKRLISLLLSAVMLLSGAFGISMNAYAKGWLDYVNSIDLDTTYSGSMSANDYCTNKETGEYIDSFEFYNNYNQNITFSFETESESYVDEVMHPTIMRIYQQSNSGNAIYEYEIEHKFDASTGTYRVSYDFYLESGSYYMTISYLAVMCDVHGMDYYNGSYDFSLKSSYIDEDYIDDDGDEYYDDYYSGWVSDEFGWRYWVGDEYVIGWYWFGEYKHYFNQYGYEVYGWQKIDSKQYYFADSGAMLTGWQKIDGKQYYFNKKGRMVTGWQKIGGKQYYFNKKGRMVTGWQKIGGKQYYFNKKGRMVTGWKKIGGKQYYFNKKGRMVTGWQKISKKWYYFSKKGVMKTGWQKISKRWYYFSKKGVMKTGWQKIGTKWYYFSKKGIMQSGWLKDAGNWYYLDGGVMLANTSKIIDGKTYQFDKDGVCLNP